MKGDQDAPFVQFIVFNEKAASPCRAMTPLQVAH
jgi:hypothetical protein